MVEAGVPASGAGAGAGSTPSVPTSDPRKWDTTQLQHWFKTYKGGKWAEYASKFAKLDGSGMTGVTEKAFVGAVGSPCGNAIYHAWQKLIGVGTLVSLCSTRALHCTALADTTPACRHWPVPPADLSVRDAEANMDTHWRQTSG